MLNRLKKFFFLSIPILVLLLIYLFVPVQYSQLERALLLSGVNRVELEQVLDYYKDDSLKLKAAIFLIENMPGHYSYNNDSIEHYYNRVDSVLNIESVLSTKIKLLNTISREESKRNYAKINDLEIIKADYLIKNIECSFDLWQNGEWAKHLSFDEFCEYLLPYKVGELQPLDNWKETLMNRYATGLDNMGDCDSYKNSAIRAAYAVNQELKDSLNTVIFYHSLIPINQLKTKLKMPFGTCADYNFIATSVMRSKGIPIMNDLKYKRPIMFDLII